MTVRDFTDKLQDFDAYTGVISHRGQRLVNAVAAEHSEFILFNFDVSQAFAKRIAFEEFSALSGQDIRIVEFDVPKVDIECLRQLPDFMDFDPVKETLTMFKPSYTVNGRASSSEEDVAPGLCPMVVLSSALY